MKRVKTTETSASDFDDVVSSQFESYEDEVGRDNNNNDNDNNDMNGRLQSQNSPTNDDHVDDDNDDRWRHHVDDDKMTATQINHQTSTLTSSLSSSWPNAVVASHSRCKRKASNSRRSGGNLDNRSNQSAPYNDLNVERVMSGSAEGDYVTDIPRALSHQDDPRYRTGKRIACGQNELEFDLQPGEDLEQLTATQRHQIRPPGSRDVDELRGGSEHYGRQNDIRTDVFHANSSLEEEEGDIAQQYALDYDDMQSNRHDDEVFSLSQYYGQDEIQYDIRPNRSYRRNASMPEYSRQNDASHDDSFSVSPIFEQNNPGQVRRGKRNSVSSEFYRQNEHGQTEKRSGMYDQSCRHNVVFLVVLYK